MEFFFSFLSFFLRFLQFLLNVLNILLKWLFDDCPENGQLFSFVIFVLFLFFRFILSFAKWLIWKDSDQLFFYINIFLIFNNCAVNKLYYFRITFMEWFCDVVISLMTDIKISEDQTFGWKRHTIVLSELV